MPSWNDIQKKIMGQRDPILVLKQEYFEKLHKKRNRNIISYYSGWLQKPGLSRTGIDDSDKNFFMSAVHGLDKEKGLDLILHTPGGELGATESLVDYLREVFKNDFEVFVPQIAMSAGTMLACASKRIHMGKQSSLGPIDPQIGGVPARAIISDLNQAAKDIKSDPARIHIWRSIFRQVSPWFGIVLHRRIQTFECFSRGLAED